MRCNRCCSALLSSDSLSMHRATSMTKWRASFPIASKVSTTILFSEEILYQCWELWADSFFVAVITIIYFPLFCFVHKNEKFYIIINQLLFLETNIVIVVQQPSLVTVWEQMTAFLYSKGVDTFENIQQTLHSFALLEHNFSPFFILYPSFILFLHLSFFALYPLFLPLWHFYTFITFVIICSLSFDPSSLTVFLLDFLL